MTNSTSPPPSGHSGSDEKAHHPEHIEHIATKDRVPGHQNYYEKNGLRTYGDGEDHDHEPKVSMRVFSRPVLTNKTPDEFPSNDVLDSHGIPVDWFSNPRLSLW
jgi:hypothetical protein